MDTGKGTKSDDRTRARRTLRNRRGDELSFIDELTKRGILEFKSDFLSVKISPMALMPKEVVDEMYAEKPEPYEATTEDDFLFSSSPLEAEAKRNMNGSDEN